MGWKDRLQRALEDSTARTTRHVEDRLSASQERLRTLDGATYEELVSHLDGALHQYDLAVIACDGSIARLAFDISKSAQKEADQKSAAALDASAWLDTILNAVRLEAMVSTEDVERFNAQKLAELPDGDYSLVLASTDGDPAGSFPDRSECVVAKAIASFGFSPDAADELALKIRNIGPQEVITNVALEYAVVIKNSFEMFGLTARIKEGRATRGAGHRDPIPESVRHEVWRRDGAACVDCGSRERLEFDHIIPLSQGGSNTARNLELRCEACNRRKGARI